MSAVASTSKTVAVGVMGEGTGLPMSWPGVGSLRSRRFKGTGDPYSRSVGKETPSRCGQGWQRLDWGTQCC